MKRKTQDETKTTRRTSIEHNDPVQEPVEETKDDFVGSANLCELCRLQETSRNPAPLYEMAKKLKAHEFRAWTLNHELKVGQEDQRPAVVQALFAHAEIDFDLQKEVQTVFFNDKRIEVMCKAQGFENLVTALLDAQMKELYKCKHELEDFANTIYATMTPADAECLDAQFKDKRSKFNDRMYEWVQEQCVGLFLD